MNRHTWSLGLVFCLVLAGCAGVLGIKPKQPWHAFEHRAHVLAGVNCVSCHRHVSDEGRTGAPSLPSTEDCKSCHQKPHDSRPCNGCHGEPALREDVALARSQLRFEHRKHMKSVDGDCVRCHAELAKSDVGAPMPKMGSCFGCHEHKDQWTLRDCDGCHVDLSAEETLPVSHLVHDGDWIREHGVRAASARDLCASCHSERSCASCHGVGTVPALPAKIAFDEVRLEGIHRAGFSARHSLEARANPGLCSSCHSDQSCLGCHAKQGVAPGTTHGRSPHPPGWISAGFGGGEHGQQARIDPAACASCHGGAGEKLCVGCHKVGGPGGNPHGRGFSSTKRKTQDMPCRLCHGLSP
jgi:Cytochrome c7 and related cytochrome c